MYVKLNLNKFKGAAFVSNAEGKDGIFIPIEENEIKRNEYGAFFTASIYENKGEKFKAKQTMAKKFKGDEKYTYIGDIYE